MAVGTLPIVAPRPLTVPHPSHTNMLARLKAGLLEGTERQSTEQHIRNCGECRLAAVIYDSHIDQGKDRVRLGLRL
jgi:hypothetical protein